MIPDSVGLVCVAASIVIGRILFIYYRMKDEWDG